MAWRRDGGNTTETSTASSSEAALIGGSIGAVLLVLLGLSLILIIRRRRHRNSGRRQLDVLRKREEGDVYGDDEDREVQLRARSGAMRELAESSYSADRLTRIVSGEYEFPSDLNQGAIDVGEIVGDFDTRAAINILSDAVARLRDANSSLKSEIEATGHIQEYDSLDKLDCDFPSEHSQRDFNRLKNRYANVKAYDHSRVVLPVVNEDPDSDYINGNFIAGASGPHEYIATQGPIPNSFISFWRMIWDQQVSVILMVTKEVEGGRVKCHRYWPDKDSASGASVTTFGQLLEVRHVTTELHADFTVRKFTVTRRGSEPRELTHVMYTTWPDHGVPASATGFFELRKYVTEVAKDTSAPIVVHCSAGVGRTGTYIAIDTLITQAARLELPIDVHGFVLSMRQARNMMVQTVEQYMFVYAAVLEGLNALMASAMNRFFSENCTPKPPEEGLYDEARAIVPSARQSFAEVLNMEVTHQAVSITLEGLPAGESGSLVKGSVLSEVDTFGIDAAGSLTMTSVRRSNPLVHTPPKRLLPRQLSIRIRSQVDAEATSSTDTHATSDDSCRPPEPPGPTSSRQQRPSLSLCSTAIATRHARMMYLRKQWEDIQSADSASLSTRLSARAVSYEGALDQLDE